MVVKTEIEDVLSSIRRLVSEDMTARPFRAIPREPRDLDERLGEKLMLTSAHRVPATLASATHWPADGNGEAEALGDSDDPAAEWDADAAADLGGDDRWGEHAAETAADGDAQGDAPDDAPEDAPSDGEANTLQAETADWRQEHAAEPAAEEPVPAWPGAHAGSSRLEETIAELEAAVSGAADDFEADEGDAAPPEAGDEATLTAAFATIGAEVADEADAHMAEDEPALHAAPEAEPSLAGEP